MEDPHDSLLIRAFLKSRSDETFSPLVSRHLPLVHALAVAGTGDLLMARDVVRVVFQILGLKARGLKSSHTISGWLARTTWMVLQRANRIAGRNTKTRLLPQNALIVRELCNLRPKHSDPSILVGVMRMTIEQAGEILKIRPEKVNRRFCQALEKILRRAKTSSPMTLIGLREHLGRVMTGVPGSEDEKQTLLHATSRGWRKEKGDVLLGQCIRSMIWGRIRRVIRFAVFTFLSCVVLMLFAAGSMHYLWSRGFLTHWMMKRQALELVKEIPQLAEPARPWFAAEPPLAGEISGSGVLYDPDTIWPVTLEFSGSEWNNLEPKRVRPLEFINNGKILLRNTNAPRNGLAGVLGYDFHWVHAQFSLSEKRFENVAVRRRGNGTYLGSLHGIKSSYKIDLNKHQKGQKIAGLDTLNLNNLIEDSSYMHDTLGYAYFRESGVPAPRTAYAWVTFDVEGRFQKKPIGLYLLLENVDEDFAEFRFGTKKTPIFKPVTQELFEYLGESWTAYERIYDLKTAATEQQKRRLIDFAQLVTSGSDDKFREEVSSYLDLEAFARFLAGMVMLSSYDGFLSNGQNFYMYLDPRSNKFGFIPWDLDHGWGEFGYVGSAKDREQASIFRPSTYRNRFLNRVMKLDSFKTLYCQTLEGQLTNQFESSYLFRKIDLLAPKIRDAVAAESEFRLRRFEQAISTNWISGPRDVGEGSGPKKPPHQLKRFIINRAVSVREQLEGRSEGVVMPGMGQSRPARDPE